LKKKEQGFGLAPVKAEGEPAQFDTAGDGAGTGTPTHWMELPLEEGWTREQVHADVERWLESHGWTTKPTKFPGL
jgi:hypothetical protein